MKNFIFDYMLDNPFLYTEVECIIQIIKEIDFVAPWLLPFFSERFFESSLRDRKDVRSVYMTKVATLIESSEVF